jgi:hypothetical protein
MTTKKTCALVAVAAGLMLTGTASADLIEGFDDISTLAGDGWVMINNSEPAGDTDWFQGNDVDFAAHQGAAANSYISANYLNTGTGGPNTISNWLITPEMLLNNGDTVSFFTRTVEASDYPDRLELRMSTGGSSTGVGTSSTSVGDFNDLLLSVNPSLSLGGYPDAWTQMTVTISGLAGPTAGRLAFRYYVTDSGPAGFNGNLFGIDTFEYASVPGPGGLLVLAGAAAIGRRRRRTR